MDMLLGSAYRVVYHGTGSHDERPITGLGRSSSRAAWFMMRRLNHLPANGDWPYRPRSPLCETR